MEIFTQFLSAYLHTSGVAQWGSLSQLGNFCDKAISIRYRDIFRLDSVQMEKYQNINATINILILSTMEWKMVPNP